MYPLDPDLMDAIEESDFVALELDLTKVNQKQTLKLVNDKALLTDGTALQDHVSDEDYAKFEAIMKKSAAWRRDEDVRPIRAMVCGHDFGKLAGYEVYVLGRN